MSAGGVVPFDALFEQDRCALQCSVLERREFETLLNRIRGLVLRTRSACAAALSIGRFGDGDYGGGTSWPAITRRDR